MKSKSSSVLGELRKTIRMNQAQFAELIGVSVDTIKGLEARGNRMTEAMARRISLATGVDAKSLISGKLLNRATQVKFRVESFYFWRSTLFATTEVRAIDLANNLGRWIEVLFMAAARSKREISIHSFALEIAANLEDLAAKSNLEEGIHELLKAFTQTETHRLKGSQWKKLAAEEQKRFGLTSNALKRMRDYEEYDRVIPSSQPVWRPDLPLPDYVKFEMPVSTTPEASQQTSPVKPSSAGIPRAGGRIGEKLTPPLKSK